MPSGARPFGADSFSIEGANADSAERDAVELEADDIEVGEDDVAGAVGSRSGSRVLLQPDAAAIASTPHALAHRGGFMAPECRAPERNVKPRCGHAPCFSHRHHVPNR
jgi:hypothetical protein